MLKHLVPNKKVFPVFINSNYGCALLSPNHWYVVEKILEFLELFHDCTVVLSGVYYPTSLLVLHPVLEIASHLHACEKDQIGLKGLHSHQTIQVRENRLGEESLKEQVLLVLPLPSLHLHLPSGLAWPTKWPIVSCLGRRPNPRA
jgi:hypothetical protein